MGSQRKKMRNRRSKSRKRVGGANSQGTAQNSIAEAQEHLKKAQEALQQALERLANAPPGTVAQVEASAEVAQANSVAAKAAESLLKQGTGGPETRNAQNQLAASNSLGAPVGTTVGSVPPPTEGETTVMTPEQAQEIVESLGSRPESELTEEEKKKLTEAKSIAPLKGGSKKSRRRKSKRRKSKRQ